MAATRVATLSLGLMLAAGASAADLLAGRPKADALLPVDQAFQLGGAEQKGNSIAVHWQIAPGYYLYGHQFKVRVESPGGQPAPALALPAGETKHDAEFGDVTIYRQAVAVGFPAGKVAPRTLRVSYQGCADLGVCYPPQTRLIAVK